MTDPIITAVRMTRYRAPTSGNTRATKPAAYREEARARLAARCDCDEYGYACWYHDEVRWRAGSYGKYSRNGLIVARLAVVLAREDGLVLPWPAERLNVAHPCEPKDFPF